MKRLAFFGAGVSLDLAAAAAGAQIRGGADAGWRVRAVAPLDRADRDEVTAFFAGLDLDDLRHTRAGACFVEPDQAGHLPPTTVALVTPAPREAMWRLAALLHPASLRPGSICSATGIDHDARVSPSARLEADVVVDPGALVGDEVEIGSGTIVGAHCVIGAGVRVGRDCAIGAGAVLVHALVGDRVVILSGARLGDPDDDALAHDEPSLGRVIVQNDVAIGANAVVARGRLADTVIGEGARLPALAWVGGGTVVARGEVVPRRHEVP